MKKLNLLCVLNFLCCFSFINAQEKEPVAQTEITYPRLTKFPLLNTNYNIYPQTVITTPNGDQKIKITEWKNSIFIPTPLKNKKTTLLNKLDYNCLNFESNQLLEKYHLIKYRFIVVQKLKNYWSYALGVSPTLASDFNEKISSNDFNYEANAVMFKRVNPYLKLGLGTTYTTVFGKGIFVPIINVVYKKNKWLTNIYIPQSIVQSYQINAKSNIALAANLTVNLYNVRFEEFLDASKYDKILYSHINLGPRYQHKLFDDLYLYLSGGISIRNLLEVQNQNFEVQQIYNVKNSAYLQIGLQLLK